MKIKVKKERTYFKEEFDHADSNEVDKSIHILLLFYFYKIYYLLINDNAWKTLFPKFI